MLDRARARTAGLTLGLVEGDSQALPFANACFDHAILHLILAVVPDPVRCLAECARVLKPGATVLVLDKFLRRGEHAWLRRALNPLARRIVTRTDVVFEDVLAAVPALRLIDDRPALARGWFRLHSAGTATGLTGLAQSQPRAHQAARWLRAKANRDQDARCGSPGWNASI